MKRAHLITAFAFTSALAIAAFAAGCDGDDNAVPHDTVDASTSDTGGGGMDSGGGNDTGTGGDTGGGDAADGGPPSCYTNPQTHYEIINACTDAQSFDKSPRLPLLQPDGSLPPLP